MEGLVTLICSHYSFLDACWLNKHSLVFTHPFRDLTFIDVNLFSLQYPHKTSHQIKQNTTVTFHGMFLEWRNTTQILEIFDNLSYVYLMGRLQKYARNWNFTMFVSFICKTGQTIKPIQQNFFALSWSVLKKLSLEFNFFHIFEIPSSSRHEKQC